MPVTSPRRRSLPSLSWKSILVISFVLGSGVRGDLILLVDPTTQTFWVSGDATGTTASSTPHVSWLLTGTGGSGNVTQSLLDPEPDAIIFDGGGPTTRFDLILQSSQGGSITIEYEGVASTAGTFTGTGSTISYAGWNNAARTQLENIALAGTPLALNTGSGFGLGLDVGIAAVPEPSGGLLTGLLLGSALICQRRRRKNLRAR